MLWSEVINGFEFKDDTPIAHKIHLVVLVEGVILILYRQMYFPLKRNVPVLKFIHQSFLINYLLKSRLEFIMHFHTGAHYIINLLLDIHSKKNCLKLLINVIEVPACGGFGRFDWMKACFRDRQSLQSQSLEEAEHQSPVIVGEEKKSDYEKDH